MKKIYLTGMISVLIISGLYAAPDTTKVSLGKNKKIVQVIDNYDGTNVIVGEKGAVMVQDKGDTVKIKIGRKGIKIVESDNGTNIQILDEDDMEKEFHYKTKKSFKGNWAGIEFGMNNYLTPDLTLPDNFLTLHTGKSWNLNINFMQYSFPLVKQSVGLVTGLGFQMNDYKFSGNNNIEKDAAGNIIELPYIVNLRSSKLHVNYLTLPIILEFHLNPDHYGRKFYISAGVIGSMKLWSYTKIKFYDEGNKEKNKIRDDFRISPLQYAGTIRFGFKEIRLYANYNLNTLFQKGKAPELYPFSVGLALLQF